jgi:hypothetical protein|tara:strand:- start:934 stop:1107 length:174 start_codon:yes stop_codon:yes gene_type:complete
MVAGIMLADWFQLRLGIDGIWSACARARFPGTDDLPIFLVGSVGKFGYGIDTLSGGS